MLLSIWRDYEVTLGFCVAGSFFALSTYATMWVGVFSFAPVAFGAVAAFTNTYLQTEFNLPFAASAVIGVCAATLVAAILAVPLRRLESHWLALATVALVLFTRVIVLGAGNVTGGSVGESVSGNLSLEWMALILLVASWVLSKLYRSRFGYAASAVEADPIVGAAMGVNVARLQAYGFVMSGALGGVGGVTYATWLGYISPDTFYVTLAFYAVAGTVLGGSRHWSGPILGAFIFTLLPQVLGGFFGEGKDIANGVLLLAVVLFFPGGLINPRRDSGFIIRWVKIHARRAHGT